MKKQPFDTPYHQETLTKRLARRLLPMIMLVGLMLGFVIPGLYLFLEYKHLVYYADSYGQEVSRDIKDLASGTGALWKYQATKFDMIIRTFAAGKNVERVLVLDEEGKTVTSFNFEEKDKKNLLDQFVFYSSPIPIKFNNKTIGTVIVWVSASIVLFKSFLMFLACLLMGGGLSVLIYRFPLRVVAKLEEQLLAYQRMLERKVEERTQALQIAAERARELSEEAQEASRAKSQFLANMSHEIRTPMNGVLGMAELLLMTELDEEQRNYAETVFRSGGALMSLLNDILDYSKIEAGKLKLQEESFNLCTCVENVIQLFSARAWEKKVDLMYHIVDDVPLALFGDSTRLAQVLANLVGNAVKFTQQGEILLRVTSIRRIKDVVFLRLEIRDTGIGIKPEYQEKIFESFSQADASTTRKFGGTGLGLAISKELVEMMGGEIALVSSSDKGTTFGITLPMKVEAVPGGVDLIVPEEVKKKRVLIVDHNETSRYILFEQIQALGMRPEQAVDGQQALAMLKAAALETTPFSLCIVEKAMPGMNGLELSRQTHAEEPLASLPFIFLFALDEEDKSGGQKALFKPVRKAALYAAITEVLGTKPIEIRSLASEQEQPFEGGRFPEVRVLLAEDNPVNQQVARKMLEKLSCQVDIVGNGQEALELLSQKSFDIIFMDCQMPVLDGWAATKIIREKDLRGRQHDRLPIVAMTAYAMQGDAERCFEAGMDDYLKKPFTMRDLLAKFHRWVPGTEETNAKGRKK